MNDIIIESAFTIAINVVLSQRRISSMSNRLYVFPVEKVEMLFDSMNSVLKEILQNNYNEGYLELIKIEYYNIMSNNNTENLINSHYNELFGASGGNVI